MPILQLPTIRITWLTFCLKWGFYANVCPSWSSRPELWPAWQARKMRVLAPPPPRPRRRSGLAKAVWPGDGIDRALCCGRVMSRRVGEVLFIQTCQSRHARLLTVRKVCMFKKTSRFKTEATIKNIHFPFLLLFSLLIGDNPSACTLCHYVFGGR